MEILPRSSWGAAPPKSRTLVSPSKLDGVTVHWFGSPRAASSHDGCDDLLRSVQRGHMAPGGLNTKNGGSDIAYNHAVCPHGVLYELRGFGVQTGANGTSYANENYAAIVYMAGVGDPLTDVGKRGLNFLIQAWRALEAGYAVFPHKRWTGSDCPGPALLGWLAAGHPEPNSPKEDPDVIADWVGPWVKWYVTDRRAETRPAGVPSSIPDDVMALVGVTAEIRKIMGTALVYQAWRDWHDLGGARPGGAPATIYQQWWDARERDVAWSNKRVEPKLAELAERERALLTEIEALEVALAAARQHDDARIAELEAQIAAARTHANDLAAVLGS